MKKGEIATIFEDPITEQKEEGKARLIKKYREDHGQLECWKVKFLSDGFIADRNILKKEV